MKPNIIEGYKGVMPLDLSSVDPIYHKIMIAQHKKDIKEYIKYQAELPTQLRYENTTEKALNLHLFSFKTPILIGKKIRKKCKINSRSFTYDGLTFYPPFV